MRFKTITTCPLITGLTDVRPVGGMIIYRYFSLYRRIYIVSLKAGAENEDSGDDMNPPRFCLSFIKQLCLGDKLTGAVYCLMLHIWRVWPCWR